MLNFSKENSNYFRGFQTSDKHVKLLIKLFTNFTNYVPDHGIVPVLVLLHATVVPHRPRGSHLCCPLGPRQGRRLPHELEDAAATLHPGSGLRSPPAGWLCSAYTPFFSTTFHILEI
jgi:hypothetical protein